jgi:hypothetical protein
MPPPSRPFTTEARRLQRYTEPPLASRYGSTKDTKNTKEKNKGKKLLWTPMQVKALESFVSFVASWLNHSGGAVWGLRVPL